MRQWLQQAWYGSTPWLILLWPLECLFTLLAKRRRARLQACVQWQAPVPIIVVGNISVGGVGKTPLVVALVEQLRQQGYQPGVVSRGYGGAADSYPHSVSAGFSAKECGDEPLMIALRCQCPVVVDSDRLSACKHLLDNFHVDVIVSDDGLQHYAMPRDIEIAVVDGERLLGNGHCLPVGPLREPAQRLQDVDFVILNGGESQSGAGVLDGVNSGFSMGLNLAPLQDVATNDLVDLPPQPINAMAGIGNPQRFFDSLQQLGYTVQTKVLPDHYDYQGDEWQFANGKPVVVTEKDAVKIRPLLLKAKAEANVIKQASASETESPEVERKSAQQIAYLPVSATLPDDFWRQLFDKLRTSATR